MEQIVGRKTEIKQLTEYYSWRSNASSSAILCLLRSLAAIKRFMAASRFFQKSLFIISIIVLLKHFACKYTTLF